MEVQLQSWNFKPKGETEVKCDYFLKLVGLYQIQDIQVAPSSTLKKRQKKNNKWELMLPRIEVIDSVLNPLPWIVVKKVPKSDKIKTNWKN